MKTKKELRELRKERDYWYGRARMDTASLSRTLVKVREVEKRVEDAEQENECNRRNGTTKEPKTN
jgi:hypothetical protein